MCEAVVMAEASRVGDPHSHGPSLAPATVGIWEVAQRVDTLSLLVCHINLQHTRVPLFGSPPLPVASAGNGGN